MQLEKILEENFCRLVSIDLDSGAVFVGYLVGVKLPILETLMLYYVQEKYIDKYIKNQNSRWVEQLPYELIKEIHILPQENHEREYLLKELRPSIKTI